MTGMLLAVCTYKKQRKDEPNMNRAISVVLAVFLAGVAATQIRQRELLSGRYYTPSRLRSPGKC